jgi:hypothetical protein
MQRDEPARPDLVEPEGVNAGSAPAERDRRGDGEVAADDVPRRPPEQGPDAGDELVGPSAQRPGEPGQQLAEGEG